jgi:hypothetical protein
VFAAWVTYTLLDIYALDETSTGGEMPQYYCAQTETSGSRMADLVVARLTGSEPVLTHFHFVMRGAVKYGKAARARRAASQVATWLSPFVHFAITT